MDRDCKNCVYSNMTEYTNGCTRWSCEYINIDEAVEAWKEKYRKVEVKYCGNKLPETDGDIWDELATIVAKTIDEKVLERLIAKQIVRRNEDGNGGDK